ncbi:hypothetical protein SLEP1_g36911 [Rubroshorea leprosula]|uniref:KIB1-4 beta-propeller domain-containing protein n=1 Tax=Rubroshorea leprosula TaxID=152421 RepID=A0AAV5KT22_9ROSI|nr:hypothetical protein SLEP1_g36911 [Rubroshorea leprosula]
MEEETGDRKLVAPQPLPLVVLTQYPSLKFNYFVVTDEEREIKIPPKLRRKEIRTCCHGWIIFSRGRHQYSLWNPFTNERIHLPAIDLKHKHGKCQCQFVLSSPPINCDSMVVLIDTGTPSLNFCRIADKQWTKQPIQDDYAGFSYPATGLEVNRVHYDSAYLFNMEDKTISTSLPSLPYLYLQRINDGSLSFYIMPNADSRLSNYVERQINDHLAANASEILRDTTSDHDQEKAAEAEFDYFGKLPLDVQSVIASPSEPVIRGIEGYNSLPPWLTFWEKGDSVCNFIDPTCCQKYIMTIPDNESKDVTMCYSREGWCLMLHGEGSIFLWKPLAKKIIPLPNLPYKCRTVFGCGFSTSPDSSNCVIVMLCHDAIHRRYYIDFISLKYLDKEWDINFLLECDGKLLSVTVARLGKWLRIFRLDDSETVWVEVENLGNYTLYVSRAFHVSLWLQLPD